MKRTTRKHRQKKENIIKRGIKTYFKLLGLLFGFATLMIILSLATSSKNKKEAVIPNNETDKIEVVEKTDTQSNTQSNNTKSEIAEADEINQMADNSESVYIPEKIEELNEEYILYDETEEVKNSIDYEIDEPEPDKTEEEEKIDYEFACKKWDYGKYYTYYAIDEDSMSGYYYAPRKNEIYEFDVINISRDIIYEVKYPSGRTLKLKNETPDHHIGSTVIVEYPNGSTIGYERCSPFEAQR